MKGNFMQSRVVKHCVHVLATLSSLALCIFAIQQYRYMHLIEAGNQAVSEQRFDTQDYDRAGSFWLARQDILLVNQAVLAYKAQNYPRAVEFLRRASQSAPQSAVKGQALYNLGRIFLELKEAERAAEFFKAALRLDPTDRESKYNLERLYHFVMMKKGQHTEASLEQAPGNGEEQNKGTKGKGQGRSQRTPDI